MELVKAERNPFPTPDLSKYEGQYGDRQITLEDSTLVSHSPFGIQPMLHLNENTFAIGDEIRAIFNGDTMTLEWRDIPRKMTFEKMTVSSQT